MGTIEFRGIKKSFGSKHVLRGVDLDVKAGEVFFIIGQSGAGKSVMVKHLIGLIRPDEGRIYLDGVDITRAIGQVERLPMLCVAANQDGIVPVQTALSALDHIGSRDTRALIVGDATTWYAHADMFIARDAQRRVFEPLAKWLESKTPRPKKKKKK